MFRDKIVWLIVSILLIYMLFVTYVLVDAKAMDTCLQNHSEDTCISSIQ